MARSMEVCNVCMYVSLLAMSQRHKSDTTEIIA